MSSPPRVFLTRPLPDPGPAKLEGFQVEVHPGPWPIPREALLAGAAACDGLIVQLTDPVDDEVLRQGLRALGVYAVGVNNVDLAAAARRGVPVVNTPDVLTEATADLTWALLLAVTRRLLEGDRVMRADRFPGWAPDYLLGSGLQGKTLGVVGMGRIGQAVARRARAFGMAVAYASRSPLAERVEERLEAERLELDELLRVADVLSLHAPLTDQTRHLMDGPRLRAMKPGSYLINTARGPLVDEAALVQVLAEGPLAGAGLDVFEDEPHAHPGLRLLENVVLAPHVGSATREARAAMSRLVCGGVAALLRGQTPPNLVAP